jgi:hypothetical protein
MLGQEPVKKIQRMHVDDDDDDDDDDSSTDSFELLSHVNTEVSG